MHAESCPDERGDPSLPQLSGSRRAGRAAAACLVALAAALLVSAEAFAAAEDEPDISGEALRALNERGFVVVPGESLDFPETYAVLGERGLPPIITADYVIRMTDLLIDRVLRTVEDEQLYGRLEQLSREMVRMLEEDYLRARDPMVEEAARLDVAYFAVGLSLLNPDYFPPESVRGLVERELELIEDADRTAISPIMGQTPLDKVVGPGQDYTRFIPTGHYADSERLSRYFRALVWYGDMAFALPERPIEDYTLTMQALLIVRALEREAGEWHELWERVSGPTTFYRGGAGDPSVSDYMALADDVFDREFDREAVASESLLAMFVDRVSEIAPVHVETHELRGMRFLPRDFPPATTYFGLLASSADRPLPTSLDMMALLGSQAARGLLEENDVFDSRVYRQTYDEIELRFDTMTYGEWTRDLYWGWLYALSALHEAPQPTAPRYLHDAAWGYKEVSTGAAAWAAVRYQAADTALTGMLELPPGFGSAGGRALVEPYPLLYARLRELVENMTDQLWEHYLLTDEIESHVSGFVDMLTFLERVSGRLIAGGDVGDTGGRLAAYADLMALMAGPTVERAPGRPACVLLSDAAYVDLDTGRVLENSVGTPDVIYVLSGHEGDRTVYAGAVYSFFESELEDRSELSAGGWPSVLRACPPDRPHWVRRFLLD